MKDWLARVMRQMRIKETSNEREKKEQERVKLFEILRNILVTATLTSVTGWLVINAVTSSFATESLIRGLWALAVTLPAIVITVISLAITQK